MNWIKITPDKEKAKSMLSMVETTEKMISTIDEKMFTSNIVAEYYNVIRQLMTAIMLLDGFKTTGEGAHKSLILYLNNNYEEFSEYEINLIDELRITRNKIEYDGFFVKYDYVQRKKEHIISVISKLKQTIVKRL
ncbi:MAG: hypothetical protein HYT71_02220 [Candidatus Aenigmarchaeota archaeon]|nr:hypothetical protein [Candidatus Aenigmarchaeota archaeon]